MSRIEYACLGKVEETKASSDGKFGIVEGYIASWKVEDGLYPDRFERGAFADSIEEHKRRGQRPVRLLRQHDRTRLIGGFPISTVREDAKGLWGSAELNLELQEARDTHALAKQGVLSDFSIGFRALDFRFEKNEAGVEVRVITKATIYEGSLVDEPMNVHAVVTAVKSVDFSRLDVGPAGVPWDAEAALERVLDMKAREGDVAQAFLDVARKYQIADFVDGQLVVNREAVLQAAEQIKGLGSAAPDDLVRHCERYLDRMGVDSPFDDALARSISVDQVKLWTPRDMESALESGATLSRSAIRYLTKHQGGLVDPAASGVQCSDPLTQALLELQSTVRRGAA